jgi:hypothetical protein
MVENNPTLQLEIAELLVDALNLDVIAAEIEPDAPLYGDGLGLDSIDILEKTIIVFLALYVIWLNMLRYIKQSSASIVRHV